MNKLLKEAKLEQYSERLIDRGIKIADLDNIITKNTSRIIDKIRKLIPILKIFDCHKLKATLHDLKKSGKLKKLIKEEKNIAAKKRRQEIEELKAEKSTKTKNISERTLIREKETITPDKKPINPLARLGDSLRAKRRK